MVLEFTTITIRLPVNMNNPTLTLTVLNKHQCDGRCPGHNQEYLYCDIFGVELHDD